MHRRARRAQGPATRAGVDAFNRHAQERHLRYPRFDGAFFVTVFDERPRQKAEAMRARGVQVLPQGKDAVDFGLIALDLGLIALDPGLIALDPGLIALDPGLIAVDPGLIALDLGLIALDPGLIALDPGLIALDLGLIALDLGLIARDLRLVALDLGLIASDPDLIALDPRRIAPHRSESRLDLADIAPSHRAVGIRGGLRRLLLQEIQYLVAPCRALAAPAEMMALLVGRSVRRKHVHAHRLARLTHLLAELVAGRGVEVVLGLHEKDGNLSRARRFLHPLAQFGRPAPHHRTAGEVHDRLDPCPALGRQERHDSAERAPRNRHPGAVDVRQRTDVVDRSHHIIGLRHELTHHLGVVPRLGSDVFARVAGLALPAPMRDEENVPMRHIEYGLVALVTGPALTSMVIHDGGERPIAARTIQEPM